MAIAKGSMAPDFTLKGHDDKDYRLADFRGRKVVLVFYPLDFSPFCSDQHACVLNDLPKFNQSGAQVLGISVDSTWAHKAFAEKMGIRYPLLADFHPRGDVGRKFGVYDEAKGINLRTTFVIDGAGHVAEVIESEIASVPQTAPVLDAVSKAR
jgi:peroxiredoxin (alkyl hydroperoxide reductase subunit C)